MGSSWSGPRKLNVTVPQPYTAAVKPAVGHGLQIQSQLCQDGPCAKAGRLIMPFVCTNGSSHGGDSGTCDACHACLLFSDDHGSSWSFGGFGQADSREAQVGCKT